MAACQGTGEPPASVTFADRGCDDGCAGRLVWVKGRMLYPVEAGVPHASQMAESHRFKSVQAAQDHFDDCGKQ
jgi:hypothetical protein